MDRKEFLKSLGAGAAFTLTYACLGGCTKMENPPKPVDSLSGQINIDKTSSANCSVDFTINLTEPQYSSLATPGNFIVVNNQFVVARANNGDYVAATRICTHQAYNKIEYWSQYDEWICTEHGASFDKTTGAGTNTTELPPNNIDPTYNDIPLEVYNTSLNGNMLRVFKC
ncbi:MAG: Rieske 2Fe-2S domain-containing protein [Flavobacteriales bacterium]|nr:Rieske 2Fe-2S domain-containing protein [Flavobacteriales bacterium]